MSGVWGTLGCERPRQSPPNVLLISIDTLRADRLGVYGYERNTSPFLDEQARAATVFENAMSPAPWTLPAHASILTSRYPRQHGATDATESIHESLPLLSERLSRAGYETAAFVSARILGSRYGFDRGFTVYDLDPRRSAPELNGRALEWLAGRRGPWFLFLHYFDVHGPYLESRPGSAPRCASPEPGRFAYFAILERHLQREALKLGVEIRPFPKETGADPIGHLRRVLRSVSADLSTAGQPDARSTAAGWLQLSGKEISLEERACLSRLYDDGVDWIDFHLERLFEGLSQGGQLEDTLVVMTSDHGEDLFDHHDHRTHGHYLYQSSLHVPLVIRIPGQHRGNRVSATVSTLDISPTILDFAGIERDPMAEGVSLRSVIEGAGSESIRRLFAEATQGPVDRSSIRQGSWKLIRDPDRARLFDLRNDPGEKRPIRADSEVGAPLLAALEDRNAGESTSQDIPLDPETREDLRALGYLN